MELQNKTMAITGVAGFIGMRMAERAQQLGMQVCGMDLSPVGVERAVAMGVDAFVGNICQREDCEKLASGANIVFHTAAVVKEYGPTELFRQINVQGSMKVAQAAQQAGVQRFVHLSSIGVYGFSYPPGVDEEGPLHGANNPYCTSKIEGEKEILNFHQSGQMEVVIIRPGDVYGPGSVPWVLRPVEMLRKNMMVLPKRGQGLIHHVYIDNLIDGIFLALERDQTGQTFNITDLSHTSCSEFFGYYTEMLGKGKIPTVPTSLMTSIAWIVEKVCRWIKKDPPLTPTAVRFLSKENTISCEKSVRLLGYKPRVTLGQGMKKVETYLIDQGLIGQGKN